MTKSQQEDPWPEDRELISGLLDRNEDALLGVLLRHGPKIKGCLVDRFGHVLQWPEIDASFNLAAFNLWRFVDRFDIRRGSLGGWFLQIAYRVAQDILRGELKHRHTMLDYEPVDWSYGNDDGTEGKENQELIAALDSCIKRLPPQQKVVIESDLAAGDVADAERLAKIHGTTAGSIRTSRHKARKRIAKELASYFTNGEES